MAPMAAPDKIYLQELSDGTWDDCFVYESSETDTKGKKRIPYIRKEALLEYAKARLLQYDPDYSSAGRELQMIIDRLNEM